MARDLENRSLDRAITVLEVLARETRCSLHQLHQCTALPKSTLRRLVGTLTKRHLVRIGISDGLFRPNIALPWSVDRAHAAHIGRVVEVALPHMVDLTRQVEWPSDLHVYNAGRMQIVESTYSLSPYRIGKRAAVDLQVSMFSAAAGLAYLSRLDKAQVLALAQSEPDHPRWGFDRIGISETALLRELAGIRKAGYAFSVPASMPRSRRGPTMRLQRRSATARACLALSHYAGPSATWILTPLPTSTLLHCAPRPMQSQRISPGFLRACTH